MHRNKKPQEKNNLISALHSYFNENHLLSYGKHSICQHPNKKDAQGTFPSLELSNAIIQKSETNITKVVIRNL